MNDIDFQFDPKAQKMRLIIDGQQVAIWSQESGRAGDTSPAAREVSAALMAAPWWFTRQVLNAVGSAPSRTLLEAQHAEALVRLEKIAQSDGQMTALNRTELARFIHRCRA